MKKISFLLLIVVTALVSSCKKDIQINAPYKETAIVYGLLNPNNVVQYIRINKTFLGTGNSLEMAKVPDSSNYKPGELNVKLEGYKDGLLVQTINLTDTMTTVTNADGSTSPQILHKTSDKISQDGRIYKLTIKNTRTGNVVTSQTNILGSFSISNFVTAFHSNTTGYSTRDLAWTMGNSDQDGSGQVLVSILFHYREVTDNNDSTEKTIQFDLPQVTSSEGKSSVSGESFYITVAKLITDNPKVIARRVGKLDFILTAVTQELNNYIVINQPSTGIVQEKNQYTNINNGIGIFSSRITTPYFNKDIADASVEWLINGDYTKTLHFTR